MKRFQLFLYGHYCGAIRADERKVSPSGVLHTLSTNGITIATLWTDAKFTIVEETEEAKDESTQDIS